MMSSQEGLCPKELVIICSDTGITKLYSEICEDSEESVLTFHDILFSRTVKAATGSTP